MMIFYCGISICLFVPEPLESNQLVANALSSEATWRAFPASIVMQSTGPSTDRAAPAIRRIVLMRFQVFTRSNDLLARE